MTFTIRDLCNRYSVHENTVLQWVHSGELKALNVGKAPGKLKPRWRITEEALAAFELLRTPAQPAPRTSRRRRRPRSPVANFIK